MKSLNILNESEIETSTRTKKKGKKERCKNFLDWDRKNSWRENNRVSIPFKNWKLYSFAYIKYRIVVVMFCLFVWYEEKKRNFIYLLFFYSNSKFKTDRKLFFPFFFAIANFCYLFEWSFVSFCLKNFFFVLSYKNSLKIMNK